MIFQANGNEKKAGIARLLSDKIDFKQKKKSNEKQGRPLYNEKGVSTSRRYKNHTYLCSQHPSTEIY